MANKYVQRPGIVKLRYGIENETIEEDEDVFGYFNDPDNDDFPVDLCSKDKNSAQRYWFKCTVCLCDLHSPITLKNHVQGRSHMKKVLSRCGEEVDKSSNASSSDSKTKQFFQTSELKLRKRYRGDESLRHILKDEPRQPTLGLDFIKEVLNPYQHKHHHHYAMYTCSLEGCKSAWGNAEEMALHLMGNKHNKNYLQNVLGNRSHLTKDAVMKLSMEEDKNFRHQRDNERKYEMIQVVDDTQYFHELVSRPVNWSEAKATLDNPNLHPLGQPRSKRAKGSASNLDEYESLSYEEKCQETVDSIDDLFSKIQANTDRIIERKEGRDTREVTKMCTNMMKKLLEFNKKRQVASDKLEGLANELENHEMSTLQYVNGIGNESNQTGSDGPARGGLQLPAPVPTYAPSQAGVSPPRAETEFRYQMFD